MGNELSQLLPVVVGAVIGVGGALSASWLNARFTERRAQREREQRVLELLGARYAVISLRQPNNDTSPIEEAKLWLRESRADPAQAAFMIGMLEKTTSQTEEAMLETEQLRREISKLRDDAKSLSVQNDEAVTSAALLKQQRSALEQLLGTLRQGKKPTEAEIAAALTPERK